MTVSYPKGKSSVAKGVKAKSEKTGSPYRHRARMGKSDDVRYRNLQENDYGNTPQKASEPAGIRANPRRTMIGIG
tara:strand:- start:2404 stop:2628 length:225 start_codon:yes stop_codon:yes gene_type:complete